MAYQLFLKLRSQATDLSLRILSSWLHQQFIKKRFHVMERIKWHRHATHQFTKLVRWTWAVTPSGETSEWWLTAPSDEMPETNICNATPYLCMYARACVCVCVTVCVYMYIYIYMCVCVCMCVGTRAYVCIAFIHLEAEYSKFIVVVHHYWRT